MNLQYYRTFNEDSSQSLVGLLKPTKKDPLFQLHEPLSVSNSTNYFFVEDEPTYPIYVFKIPKEVGYLAQHELKISRDLDELSRYLPHFNKIIALRRSVRCNLAVPKKNPTEFNPFQAPLNHTRDVLIAEYIPSKLTLLDYIKKKNFTACSDTLLHQTFLALFIAYQHTHFTHYDLHLENILIRKCSERTFFLYKFEYEGALIQRLIQTNGYFPVIFDYGFAYSKGLQTTSYSNSLFYTNKGYTPFVASETTDFKTLLIRLSHLRNCPDKFKKLANDFFLKSNLITFKLDRETGWIKSTVSNTGRIISRNLEKIFNGDHEFKKSVFYKHLDEIIDMFGILIKVPFSRSTRPKDLETSLEKLVKEWSKIDSWFTKTDDKLNILKTMLEIIDELLSNLGASDPDPKTSLLRAFKLRMFGVFDEFGQFVNIESLNYADLLSSVLVLSEYVESVAYSEMKRHEKLFRVPFDSWSILGGFEEAVNYSVGNYRFQYADSVVFFDCVEKQTSSFELKDQEVIESLNSLSELKSQTEFLSNLKFEELC
ncbi:hypothetical protein DH26_gp005 [Chloriridovirus anopheles1]|uniref:Protein kinase domain-containing protein n=1 Tax=Chloriridovirus anopheles1 TaxID=1465751 RepID=W8QRA4_9VIRU|nr:hypothetical protein DH26_gp005 [Anopheles minimus iridovirus]AHL67507.1 hypothetical protein AMIV_005 [Anopheles minimus iridovirus]